MVGALVVVVASAIAWALGHVVLMIEQLLPAV